MAAASRSAPPSALSTTPQTSPSATALTPSAPSAQGVNAAHSQPLVESESQMVTTAATRSQQQSWRGKLWGKAKSVIFRTSKVVTAIILVSAVVALVIYVVAHAPIVGAALAPLVAIAARFLVASRSSIVGWIADVLRSESLAFLARNADAIASWIVDSAAILLPVIFDQMIAKCLDRIPLPNACCCYSMKCCSLTAVASLPQRLVALLPCCIGLYRPRHGILTIDGGAVKGLRPAIIIEEIEKRTKTKTHNLFDLIGGTSTGGLIAIGTGVAGKPASDLRKLYADQDRIDAVFGKTRNADTSGPGTIVQGLTTGVQVLTTGAVHSNKGLKDELKKILNDNEATKMSTAKTNVFTIACTNAGDKTMPYLFRSYISSSVGNAGCSDAKALDAGLATAAAPVYFPPHVVNDTEFFDGGLVANNPSLIAFTEAACVLWPDDSFFFLVSLGCGDSAAPSTTTATGLPTQDDQWSWWGILKGVPLVKNLKPLVDNIAPSDTFNANVEALLKRNLDNLLGKGSENGSNYWRLNPPLGNVGFTGDDKSIETMKKGMADYLADGTASGGGTKLDEICEMLNLPTYRGAARYYTLLVPFTALSIIAYIFPSGMLSFLSDEGVGGSVAPEL